MRFGYTILYVPDVVATVDFYERAFGLSRRFVHESGLYAEMETGTTALAFAAEPMAEANGLTIHRNTADGLAAGVEICFVTDTPDESYERAMSQGATSIKPIELKPWGQRVAHLRDLNGCVVEICTPM